MQDIIDFIWNNWGAIATILLIIEQLLAQSKTINSNSLFQLFVALLKKFAPAQTK